MARPSSKRSHDPLNTDRSGPASAAPGDTIELFLCGDVMLGRGIDQILPNPVDPVLRESYVRSAREYVRLAERAHGRIPRKVGFDHVRGDALPARI